MTPRRCVQVDGVLDSADQVFAEVAAPRVPATLEAYKAVMLGYGQSGVGKTYRMYVGRGI
jgi:hypothetical protein